MAIEQGTHPPRIPTLDGWRAVAIALVLTAHGSDALSRAALTWGLHVHPGHGLGLLGVDLFFALSGYLITTNLLEEEARRRTVSLESFYVRRLFRILPAACTFLGVVALLMLGGVLDVTPARWFATLFLLSNYTGAPGSWYLGHYWSLAIEEHFYLVWPFLFVALGGRPRRRLAFVVGAVVAVCLWRAVAFKYQLTWTSPAVFWGRTDLQCDGILCGVALALMRRVPRLRAAVDGLARAPIALPALALCIAVLNVWATTGWRPMMAAAGLRSAILPLLLLCTVMRPQGVVGKLLESAPLRWLGKVSYSLYLWQQLFLVWDGSRAPALAPWQSFPLGLAAALACAWASYTFIERPLIARGRRREAAAAVRDAAAAGAAR